jgi:hypothetical protein
VERFQFESGEAHARCRNWFSHRESAFMSKLGLEGAEGTSPLLNR